MGGAGAGRGGGGQVGVLYQALPRPAVGDAVRRPGRDGDAVQGPAVELLARHPHHRLALPAGQNSRADTELFSVSVAVCSGLC